MQVRSPSRARRADWHRATCRVMMWYGGRTEVPTVLPAGGFAPYRHYGGNHTTALIMVRAGCLHDSFRGINSDSTGKKADGLVSIYTYDTSFYPVVLTKI